MIDFDAVTFTYDAAVAPVLEDVDLHIDEGELCLVVGPTGTGKSTLLRMMNGLVPHFTGAPSTDGCGWRPRYPGTTGPATSPTSSAWSCRTP